LNDRDNLGKFDAKSDESIFLGYSTNSKAYRVFNKRTMVVDESMHVVFYETNPFHIKIIVMMSQFLLIIKLVHLTKLIQVKKSKIK
jgi:hypothetical protein